MTSTETTADRYLRLLEERHDTIEDIKIVFGAYEDYHKDELRIIRLGSRIAFASWPAEVTAFAKDLASVEDENIGGGR